jgi:hypothetical protein
VKWYRKAAEQGDARAQLNLGLMYAEGTSITQDYIQAYMWFDLSAGSKFGKEIGAQWRERIAKKMMPQQIAESQQSRFFCVGLGRRLSVFAQRRICSCIIVSILRGGWKSK